MNDFDGGMEQVHLLEFHWKGTLLQHGWIQTYGSMVILTSPQRTFYLEQWRGRRLQNPCILPLKTSTPNCSVRD